MAIKFIEEYYDNGRIEKSYGVNENGERDGEFDAFYPSGKLKFRSNFKDGKRDGAYESFFENGQLLVECKFVNNEIDGVYKKYDEKGGLVLLAHYCIGKEIPSAESHNRKLIQKYFKRSADNQKIIDGYVLSIRAAGDEAPKCGAVNQASHNVSSCAANCKTHLTAMKGNAL